MTTTPLASDSEAEASVPTSRRDRQQAEPADRAATAPTADEPREKVSVASLLLPPVGSVDPDNWRRPVTRSSAPTYRPPEFDAETRAALEAEAAEREAADREAAGEAATGGRAPEVGARPGRAPCRGGGRTGARPDAGRARHQQAAAQEAHRQEGEAHRRAAHPAASRGGGAPSGRAGGGGRGAREEQWTSAAPAISHLNRQFFAPPQELKPAPVEDQVMETGHDLQLRIYMREILEPWWTGEVGSTTALNRLVALRDSLADDPS